MQVILSEAISSSTQVVSEVPSQFSQVTKNLFANVQNAATHPDTLLRMGRQGIVLVPTTHTHTHITQPNTGLRCGVSGPAEAGACVAGSQDPPKP